MRSFPELYNSNALHTFCTLTLMASPAREGFGFIISSEYARTWLQETGIKPAILPSEDDPLDLHRLLFIYWQDSKK